MPFLSIIVPVFNKENYLDACINSVLSQSFKDFELLLINDGSTDLSGQKCEYYEKLDSRIVVIQQENQGVSVARNRGLILAQGRYIGFIDADDTIDKDMYKKLIENAIKFSADISVCRLKERLADGEMHTTDLQPEIFERKQGLSDFFKGRLDFSACNKIFRSEIAKKVSFEGRMFEDALYTFQAFLLADASVAIQEQLYNYFKSNNSVSISKFSVKYMDVVGATRKIAAIASEKVPDQEEGALALDFVMNLSLLNLILFSGNKNYLEEYNIVVERLGSLLPFFKRTTLLSQKHRMAFMLFRLSPKLYFLSLKIYCLIFPSHIGLRT